MRRPARSRMAQRAAIRPSGANARTGPQRGTGGGTAKAPPPRNAPAIQAGGTGGTGGAVINGRPLFRVQCDLAVARVCGAGR